MGTKFFKVFLRRSYAKQMILTDKNTEQKMKFSIKYFFSKCNQIRSWSHLLKKFSVENFIFFFVRWNSFLEWRVPDIIFWIKKMTRKVSYNFLNTLIQANTLIIKVLTRSFIMLNTMMENERKSFTNISILSLRSCYLHCTKNEVFH